MKIKQFLKRAVATCLTVATLLTSFSIEAFAGYNGGGGGSQDAGYVKKGVNSTNWGYRFAIVDADSGKVQKDAFGYLVTDVVQFDEGSTHDETAEGAYTDNFVRTDKNTDLGDVDKKYKFYDGMPVPVIDTFPFQGNGKAFKAWMLSDSPEENKSWAQYIIMDLFDTEVAKKVAHGDYKLVVEPIYLFPMYNRYQNYKDMFGTGVFTNYNDPYGWSSYTGKYFYGTYTASLKALENLPTITGVSAADGGSGGLMGPAVQISAQCMVLEFDELGLIVPTHETTVSNIRWSNLGTQGYGIHIYSPIDDGDNISTYDVDNEPKVPALAEEPTKEKGNTGKVTIYKVYGQIHRDPDTNKAYEIEHVDTFIREGCTNSIAIVDEDDKSGYQVKAWTADTYSYKNWQYTSGTHKGEYFPLKANKWAKVDGAGNIYYETQRSDSQIGETYGQFYMASDARPAIKSTGAQLTYSEENPLELNKKNKTLYVLYLKDADKISTLGDPSPTPDTFKPEDPTDKPSKQGEFSIVKVYGKRNTETGEITHVTTTYQKNTTYLVEIIDEPIYKVTEWHVVDRDPNTSYQATDWWCSTGSKFALTKIIQSGINLYNGYDETIYCKKNMTSGKKGTLYVLYLKDDEPEEDEEELEVDITESYIAKRFMLGSMDSAGGKYKDHVFKWNMPEFNVPGSHDGIWSWPDAKLKLKIDQKIALTEDMGVLTKWTDITEYSNPKVPNLTYRKKFEIRNGVNSCKIKSEKTWELKNLEFFMVLYRLDDEPNLFKTNISGEAVKNSNADNLISNSNGVFKYDKANSDRRDNGEYDFSFNLSFDESDENDYIRKCKCYDYHYSWRTGRRYRVYTTETNETSFDTSTKLDITQQTTYATYAGKDNTVKVDVGNPDEAFNTYDHGDTSEAGVTLNVGSLTFRPYIRMQYDTHIKDNREVYVTGDKERELEFNEYVGVSFDPNKNDHNIANQSYSVIKGKLTISSSQWSNHATANAAIGKTDCVLPGGATLDLMVMKDDRQIVKVTGFFPVIAGTGLKQVSETGGTNSGIPTDTTQAEQEFEQFVQTVEHSLETWNVVQWITEDTVVKGDTQLTNITKPVWELGTLHPTKVYANDGKFGGAEDESKYYFRSDNDYSPTLTGGVGHEDANTGDLDVKRGNIETKFYTFYTDTLGNIYVKTASSLGGATLTSVNDTGTDGKLLVSRTNSKNDLNNLPAFYKDLDKKTGVITKLYYGLESCRDTTGVCEEQCTALDTEAKWINDGKWYNEAFDGITVVFMSTTLTVGFTKPGTRTSILDPKLIGNSASKSDLLTNYRLSQFRMDDHSEFYGTVGKIGEFKSIDVIVNGMENMFISDIFYVPNATVQDLR